MIQRLVGRRRRLHAAASFFGKDRGSTAKTNNWDRKRWIRKQRRCWQAALSLGHPRGRECAVPALMMRAGTEAIGIKFLLAACFTYDSRTSILLAARTP